MDKMEQAIMGMPGPFLGPFSGPKNKSPLSHSPSHMDHGKNDKHERPSKLFDDFDDVFEPLASEEALLSFIDDITDVIDSLDDEQDSNIEHDDVDTPNNSTASSVFEAIESLIEKPQNHLIDAIEKLVTAEVDETIIISGPTKPTSNAKEHQTTSLPNKILTVVCHPLMVSAMLFSSALSAFVWIKYGRKKQRKPYYSHVPNTEDEETANLINE
ncbi:8657_t:CDS:1 [Ambispora gerdemannii]|uniref:8657_t:CDS:1 n=1 Tax=Ambispora gerdemannii TaxID=144530 RepID=A0A9N9BIF0_9GLOM|nr:8657_t:CDS:1 [Ambispora gerdemannii]